MTSLSLVTLAADTGSRLKAR
ncbi:hypothetical protein YPPY56_2785, partial [Yersinia pestis PY-56]